MTICCRYIRINGEGYYKLSRGKDPEPIQVSNFVLTPRSKIVQGPDWWFICSARRSTGEVFENIVLSRSHFRRASTFSAALSGYSYLEYYGNNRDTTEIRGLLTDAEPPLKIGTDKNGLHKINGTWVYVEGKMVVDGDGPTDEIVYTSDKFPENKIPHMLDQRDLTEGEIQVIADHLNGFNDASVVYLILGWMGYCLLKERLADKVNRRNPILLCQGEPNSGKTETISRIIQPFFSSEYPIMNIVDATKYTFAVNGGSSNLVPIFYDEWKVAVMPRWQIRNMDSMLLAVYNQTTLPRGGGGQKIIEYAHTAPLVIAGEMTLESASIKYRIVEVFFSHKKKKGKRDCFNNLVSLPLGSFGKALLQHMLTIPDGRICRAFDEQKALVDSALHDRFRDSAALVRTGLWLILEYFKDNDIDVSGYSEGFGMIDSAIKETMAVAKETNVDKVISDFSIMAHTKNGDGKWLVKDLHYTVKDDVLSIKVAEAYARYKRYAKAHGSLSEDIGKSSFLQQLKTKDYFLDKKTVRIGKTNCNAICLDLTAMPDFVEADFSV